MILDQRQSGGKNMHAFHAKAALAVLALASLLSAAPVAAAVKSEPIAYKQDTTSLEGLMVYDAAAKGKQPGVVLVPDWMGMTDVARQYGERAAKMGYVVLVADIYGKNVRPKDMKEASAQSGLYKNDRPLMQARAKAALDQLLKSPRVDPARTAAMGFCFGGGVALELARSGADLDGVASFHGNLDTPHPEAAKNIKAKVLVLHGADDPFVTQDQVKAFQDEMRAGKTDWSLVQYGNAVHGFTNPTAGSDNSKGMAYNPDADKRSFRALQDFYQEIFASK
jgi:dienelactone hydrolase